MKNRRSTILAFLLCATLVLGIGYAALTDTLTVGGSATFNPSGFVADKVETAIKFTEATSNDAYCTGANVTAADTASMAVIFNDNTEAATSTYESSATFKVLYDTDNTTLPPVSISATATILSAGTADAAPGFSISANDIKYYEADGTEITDSEHAHLHPGAYALVTVTVTYNETLVTPEPTSSVVADIAVRLDVNTVDVVA